MSTASPTDVDPSYREVRSTMSRDDRSLRRDYHEASRPSADPSQPDQDREAQQRNAGLAIGVLALVVVAVLVALIMGGTDAFR